MVTAEELRAFRERHELSIRQLAGLAGVSKSTIQRWIESDVQQDPFREQALRRLMARMDRQLES